MQIKVLIEGSEEATLMSCNSDEIQYLFEVLSEYLTDTRVSVNELDVGNMKSRRLFNNVKEVRKKRALNNRDGWNTDPDDGSWVGR
tara:strand:- start:82 stop:339 length:258 start_codon:yes stop_codon:yes gene_type:complete